MGGMTEEQAQTDAGTRAYRPVRRGGGDARLAAGVCAGLGRATGVDPLVYRVAVVMLTVTGGLGVLVYVAGWLLLPSEGQDAAPLEGWTGRRYDVEDVLVVLGGLVAVGFLLSLLGGPGGGTLVALVVLALGLLTAQRRGVDLGRLIRTLPDHIRGDAAAGGVGPVDTAAETAGVPPARGGSGGTPAGAATATAGPEASGVRPDGLIDLGAYGRGGPRQTTDTAGGPYVPEPRTTPQPKRRGGWVASLFWLAACGAAVWAMAVHAPAYGWDGVTTIGYGAATALVVLGIGLVVGAWFGFTRPLIGWGVLLALALAVLPLIGTGSRADSVTDVVVRSHPATVAEAEQPVRMGVGSGQLDLSDVPFPAGRPVAVSAEARAGYLQVIVPRDAEVRVDGDVRIGVQLGDVRGDGRVYPVRGGHVRTTLPPLDAPSGRPPVIDLRLRMVAGDLEVRRAA